MPCVLVVLDGEGDPVCRLGPDLLSRAAAITGTPVEICLADPKYEAWLVASVESLGLGSLTYDLSADPATAIKRALGPVKYVKPTWQPRLTARIDIELARSRNASLARMLERFDALMAVI
jgi:hypothetical protein